MRKNSNSVIYYSTQVSANNPGNNAIFLVLKTKNTLNSPLYSLPKLCNLVHFHLFCLFLLH